MRHRDSDRAVIPALLGVALAAASGFAVLERAVAARKTSYADGRTRRHFPKRRRRSTKRAATVFGRVGKEWIHAPIAVGVAAYAWHCGAGAGAVVPPLASVTAVAVSKSFERWMPHRSPPPGRHSPTEPSFPSGHSLETLAVAGASAWVLVREELVRAEVAAPLALAVPIASGIGRLYLDRHWTTDVIAGWLAGLSVAAACAATYETLKD